jgi:DNA end-binding protein Ku
MPRPIWTGSLSFGLVNVPVGLYSATEDKTIHFNQFAVGTADRVKNKRVNAATGEEVTYGEIVKGYNLGGGEYVVLTKEELASVEPQRSRLIEISDFVDLSDISPIYFKSAYYLAPQGTGSDKPYGLLRKAMLETNKIGIASFVFHSKQHLVAVRPEHAVLALETMYYEDEVRDPLKEIGSLPDPDAEYGDREMKAAQLLIESMSAEWDPHEYRDTHRERILEMIEQKARGETISIEPEPEEAKPVVDLLAALEQSVASAVERRAAARESA